jgi:dimeric dUTPase (all-alpha-NTP-PPase superfamily)
MNITDVEDNNIVEEVNQIVLENDGDSFKAIFSRQKELEEKYNPIEKAKGALVPDMPLDLNTFQGQERVRLLIYRVTEELYEAGNCLRNKAWKQSEVPIDLDHFLEELMDALHFMIQLFIEIGLTSCNVVFLYFKKSIVNKFRQRTKY